MRLSCRMLENVTGVNAFEYAASASMTEGDAPTIYLQLVDLAKDRAERGFVPSGRRYVPASGATLQVTLDNIDDARKLVKTATQPFASDPSIWSFSITASDKIRGTVNLKLVLTEGSVITYGLLQAGLGVESLDGMSRI